MNWFQEAPDPCAVAAKVLDCLRLEFEPLVVVALESVKLLPRAGIVFKFFTAITINDPTNIVALLASLCLDTPCDFDEIIEPNIQVVFDRFAELQAVSASEVIERGNFKEMVNRWP